MFRIALHWQILIGMTLGAAIGITLNRTSGERSVDVATADLPKGVSKVTIRDTPDRIDIEITDSKGTRLAVVDGTRKAKGFREKTDGAKEVVPAYATVGKLKSKDAQAYELFQESAGCSCECCEWSRYC
ncbi:MAG: hypothetical protein IH991_20745 [Planctomycetes bacterium]|nr:hypothetical protein [Planctomycetota bacterium]